MKWKHTADDPHIIVQVFESPIFTSPSESTPHFEELIWVDAVYCITIPKGESFCFCIEKDFFTVAMEKGSVQLTTSGFTGEILSGNAVFLSGSAVETCLTAQNTAKIILMSLHGSLADMLLAGHMEKQEQFFSDGLAAVQETVHTLLQRESQPEENASAAFHLLSRAHRKLKQYSSDDGYPLLVEVALGIIREEFAELEGVREISDRLGITENHLVRVFTRAVGMSPGKVLRQQRIHYAQTLLTQPDMTVAIVAQLAGFSGGDYFSRVFRKETGMAPSQYARLHRQHTGSSKESKELFDLLYL